MNAESLVKKMNEDLLPVDKEVDLSDNQRPIFIIGLPRSGTTVLEQVVLHVLKLGYVDNIAAKFWNAPEYGVALSTSLMPFEDRKQRSFESSFGFIDTVFGPHEFGYFWKRFFDYGKGYHEVSDLITGEQRQSLKRGFERLPGLFDISFLVKNPAAITLNCEILHEVFDNGLFIVIHRDTYEVANSILQSREKYHGSVYEWFSGIPKDCAPIDKIGSPFDQVACQVHHYEKVLDNFLTKNSESGRIIETSYVEMVSDLEKEMKKISEFFKSKGVRNYQFKEALPTDMVTHRKVEIIWKKEWDEAFGGLDRG